VSGDDEGAASPDGAAAALVAAAAGLAPPPLKSVAYHPLPLSWKPAADSCFVKVDAPQEGQSVSGLSLIFCMTSFSKPQDEQR
jgi:hypothetical protein